MHRRRMQNKLRDFNWPDPIQGALHLSDSVGNLAYGLEIGLSNLTRNVLFKAEMISPQVRSG